MKVDSVREIKRSISDDVASTLTTDPQIRSFFASTEAPMPDGIALGIAKKDNEHLLAIRARIGTESEVARITSLASNEVDVRYIDVMKRTTPAYLQSVHRPLELGLQIGMFDKGFVGTLGFFVVDAAGVRYLLSNSHVIADEGTATPGHQIGQPLGRAGYEIGVLTRFVQFFENAPNLVDCAIARMDHRIEAILKMHASVPGKTLTARSIEPTDINAVAYNIGRTFGARRGFVSATEIDGLPVGYNRGTLVFNDQIELTGGAETDFSTAGHSGAGIVLEDGSAVGLLFAGGRDSAGVDRTYANRLTNVLSALGVALA